MKTVLSGFETVGDGAVALLITTNDEPNSPIVTMYPEWRLRAFFAVQGSAVVLGGVETTVPFTQITTLTAPSAVTIPHLLPLIKIQGINNPAAVVVTALRPFRPYLTDYLKNLLRTDDRVNGVQLTVTEIKIAVGSDWLNAYQTFSQVSLATHRALSRFRTIAHILTNNLLNVGFATQLNPEEANAWDADIEALIYQHAGPAISLGADPSTLAVSLTPNTVQALNELDALIDNLRSTKHAALYWEFVLKYLSGTE